MFLALFGLVESVGKLVYECRAGSGEQGIREQGIRIYAGNPFFVIFVLNFGVCKYFYYI
jgi:hypothetical protein